MASAELKKKLVWDFEKPVSLLKWEGVHTVCEESRCPNRFECSGAGIATFLIGGRKCTRACSFCHIATGRGIPLKAIVEKETKEILAEVEKRQATYVVITSVTRDDDEPGLARHFANLTQQLKSRDIEAELLIPDFHGRHEVLEIIGEAAPTVIAHNMETVRSLSRSVRPSASYDRTLSVYRFFTEKYPDLIVKGGLMVGLGETLSELRATLEDMKEAGVEMVTVGQYLQPSEKQTQKIQNYNASMFTEIEEMISDIAFLAWEVGPFVRSSYMASETFSRLKAAKMKHVRIPEPVS